MQSLVTCAPQLAHLRCGLLLAAIVDVLAEESVAATLVPPLDEELATVPDGEVSVLPGRASLVLLVVGGVALVLRGPLLPSALMECS